MNPVHFSSATDMWSTPQDFFDKLNAEFGFTHDVCATEENAKCIRFFTKEDDGLTQQWSARTGPMYMNPPYGNPEYKCRENCAKKRCAKRGHHNPEYKPGIIDWVKKAHAEWCRGVTVVALLPARTDSRWFQNFVLPYAELRFIRGRLKFGGHKNSAPFPSVVAVYRGTP